MPEAIARENGLIGQRHPALLAARRPDLVGGRGPTIGHRIVDRGALFGFSGRPHQGAPIRKDTTNGLDDLGTSGWSCKRRPRVGYGIVDLSREKLGGSGAAVVFAASDEDASVTQHGGSVELRGVGSRGDWRPGAVDVTPHGVRGELVPVRCAYGPRSGVMTKNGSICEQNHRACEKSWLIVERSPHSSHRFASLRKVRSMDSELAGAGVSL